MLESSKTCREFHSSYSPVKRYKELSPRLILFRSRGEQKTQDSEGNYLEVYPNMSLRKSLLHPCKSASKETIYLRSQKWQQRLSEKLNKKRWDLQVSELSSCTFVPILNKKKKQ